MTKEIKYPSSIQDVENMFHLIQEHQNVDIAIDQLEIILSFLEVYPLNIDEKSKIEQLATCCLKNHNIDCNHSVYKGFVQRLSFTFIPGISNIAVVQGCKL